MLKRRKAMIATVALAGALLAGTGTYGAVALADNPTAAPAAPIVAQSPVALTAATTTPNATVPGQTEQLRTEVLDMLKDHMGLTGPEAEQLATTMAQLMEKNGVTNSLDMLKQCDEMSDMMDGTNMMNGDGTDMMDGTNMMNGDGTDMMDSTNMMNDAGTHESHHQTTTADAVS